MKNIAAQPAECPKVPQRTKLTDTRIRNLAPNERVTLWDSVIPGLGLRATPNGTKSFLVFVGSGRRKVIGRYPLLTLTEAREKARNLKAAQTLGKTIPRHTSHSAASEDYLSDCARRNRPKTVQIYRKVLTDAFTGSIGDVTAEDVRAVLRRFPDTPDRQSLVFATLQAYFNWCIQRGYIDANPTRTLTRPKPGKPRERVLTDAELVTVYRSVRNRNSTFPRLVHFLLLTGQRRSEVAATSSSSSRNTATYHSAPPRSRYRNTSTGRAT